MTALHQSAKRAIDVLGAAGGLIALAPVLLLVALAVRHWLGSPVLFRQSGPAATAILSSCSSFAP